MKIFNKLKFNKMTTIEKIKTNKEIVKKIDSISLYSEEDFLKDAKRYIKAIKEGRIICNIRSVSSSGMSRTIKFLECSKGKNQYNYYNFFAFFKVLGFSPIKNGDYFRINGCDFRTNYTIIHRLQILGLITKKTCDNLAQMTPTVI